MKPTYVLSGPDGERAEVTSERAARALAREWLGCNRIHETPAVDGWQYWAAQDPREDAACVTVRMEDTGSPSAPAREPMNANPWLAHHLRTQRMIDATATDAIERVAMEAAADLLCLDGFAPIMEPMLDPSLPYDSTAFVADVGRRVAQVLRIHGCKVTR